MIILQAIIPLPVFLALIIVAVFLSVFLLSRVWNVVMEIFEEDHPWKVNSLGMAAFATGLVALLFYFMYYWDGQWIN